MVKFILFISFFLSPLSSFSQKIENVLVLQEANNIIITYGLETSNPCTINLFISKNGGITWQGPLKEVIGQVGHGIKSGRNTITFNVLKEFNELIGDNIQFKVEAKKIEEEFLEPFLIVEEMPEFPGGPGEMMKYFDNNKQYPQNARKAGIRGHCFYNFIVAPNGNITDVRLSNGIPGCSECDREAERVIKSMPNWKPGKQKGKAVPVRVTVVFFF